jgi:kynureninase
MMKYESTLAFAKGLDKADALKGFRKKFSKPKIKGKPGLYFSGNSLGLQPDTAKKYVDEELKDWFTLGLQGHFRSKRPWFHYHKFFKKTLAKIVGAKAGEVVAMNQLTVNLHLMLVSFYQPKPGRFKIIIEEGAFPSDQYALESQVKFHGLDPKEAIVELKPRPGEFTLRRSDIEDAIRRHGSEVALVFFGGVHYYTGQFFDIKKITEAAHDVGAYAGFDLAHAVGNVLLNLHRDHVDFAVWCTYKYLNSGPGGIGGAFVHEKHATNFSLPRLAGWWGHDEKERFLMKPGFKPMPGVDGWQLSNVPVLSGAAHLASLEIFEAAGMKSLRKKSESLTGYLEFLLKEIDPNENIFRIITPSNPKERGCQLSIYMKANGRRMMDRILKAGVEADWREPNVIRVAPVPLYNTFEEVFRFVSIFRSSLSK